MKSNWPIIVLLIVLVALAGLALRWNNLGRAGDTTQFVQPTLWTAPALTTPTAQPTEPTGWWSELPTKKPVGKPTQTQTPKP